MYTCGALSQLFQTKKSEEMKMRKVLAIAGNGQAINEVVSYEDLTQEEKEILIVPATDSIEDYANFQVRHNKKGELLGVQAHDFTEAKSKEIEGNMDKPNMLDVYVAFGRSETPIKRSDRKAAKNKLERNDVYEKAKRAFDNGII